MLTTIVDEMKKVTSAENLVKFRLCF